MTDLLTRKRLGIKFVASLLLCLPWEHQQKLTFIRIRWWVQSDHFPLVIGLKMTSRFRFRTLISFIISCMAGLCSPTFAIWSEGGHNLIAIIAFRK
jgi:hypothetical protein